MSRNRIISSGAEREPSPLLLPLPPVISRGGSRRVEIVRRLLVWQVPLQPPEERRGSSRPGGRFIVAEYKPLFEISWNASPTTSRVNEHSTWEGRERESTKLGFEANCDWTCLLARLLLRKQVGWDLISILSYASPCFLLEGEDCDAWRVWKEQNWRIWDTGCHTFPDWREGNVRKRRRLDTRRT